MSAFAYRPHFDHNPPATTPPVCVMVPVADLYRILEIAKLGPAATLRGTMVSHLNVMLGGRRVLPTSGMPQ
jgi:hypothetical protein